MCRIAVMLSLFSGVECCVSFDMCWIVIQCVMSLARATQCGENGADDDRTELLGLGISLERELVVEIALTTVRLYGEVAPVDA